MSRRWTPTLATTTALVVLVTTGGMMPSPAVTGGQPERATAYLDPSSQQRAGDALDAVVSVPDAVAETGSGADLVQGAPARPRVRLVQSSAQQDILDRYAGEVPSYVHAGLLTRVGLAFDHPVAGPFTLSSAFGWRINPTDVGPAVQFHIGLDYAVGCGTPVRAAADGTVVFAGERGTGGLRIDVDHGDGLVSSYRHNSRLLVSPGDRVGRGEVISLSGTTGNSTGCHLHFDATLDGRYVDPAQLLPSVPGRPRALDAEDLERFRAAPEHAAPAVRQGRTEDAPRTEDRDADERVTGAPVAEGRAQRPQPPVPAQRPESPASSSDKPRPSPSGTATPDQPKPAEPKPATPKPATPKPSEQGPTRPKPSVPGTPAVSDPPKPATPEPGRPTAPTTPEPTEPTEPTQPEPTEPATPEPTEPEQPEPEQPEPATPEPTEPEPTEPESSAPAEPGTPPAPAGLTDEEAALWCLPLDDDQEAPDFSEVFTGDFAGLVGLVATLDEEGLPESVTEETLIEASPSAVWLESLPACSDAEFVEAALAVRSAG